MLCLVVQSYLIFAFPRTVAHQVFLSMGILQASILEWVAISFSGDLPDPGIEPESLRSPALAGSFFTTSATWEVTSHYKNCVCNEDLCNTKKPFVSHFCGSPDTFIGLHF